MVANAAYEWDSTTGVLVQNPDTADATATTAAVGQTIADSGVINYLNKFGEMPPGERGSRAASRAASPQELRPGQRAVLRGHPVSEKPGERPRVHELSGFCDERGEVRPGGWLPGDHHLGRPDSVLVPGTTRSSVSATSTPGTTRTCPAATSPVTSPSKPALVSADTSVNVVTALAKVTALEGITVTTPMPGGAASARVHRGSGVRQPLTRTCVLLLQGSPDSVDLLGRRT